MENYILANCTDTGKVRSVNEDSMTTFDSPNGRVVVVCDGMGGQNAGDVASQLAVTVIQDILSDNTFPSPEEAITRSVIAANQAILRRASQDESLSGMGSTCVMVIIKEGKVYYGSVGDSRIYYISNGMIRQITKDQSYVQTLVDEGRISQEAAEHHQDKNQITNALGIENMTPPVVCQMPIAPEPGSVFLLCSDGLSGMINNNAILTTLSNSNVSLNERAQQLVSLANAAGGLDNITVQLIEFPRGTAEMGVVYKSTSGATAYVNTKGRKKRNTTLIAAICLLMIAVIGGGVYLYFANQKPEPKPQVVIPSQEKKKDVTPKQENKEVKETIIVKEETPEKITPKKTPNKKNNTLPLPGANKINGNDVVGNNGKPSTDVDPQTIIMRKASEGTKNEKE
ncbi:Stp1/IreP family PP2C-type Ser/Thr phosphatase [Sodaliphilus sp.]|uniref:Stp1/IreP family PP2C-type Ser/Thr phosphatase n=1 Tax=Sodaliphilus sp. TaxID=2815818 RepID=UPI00388DB8A9